MSHELDMSNGRANMAFVGEKPWHGLGQELTKGASIETWKREAGMDWDILRAPVEYAGMKYPDQEVLYRSDTQSPLGIVSPDYKEVHPGEVLEFFRDLVADAGMYIDTAGVLFGGKRFWALANTGRAATILGNDEIKGNLLLTTGADGTMATSASFVATRVVCNNTLRVALGERTKNRVRVTHRTTMDPRNIKEQLGLIDHAWQNFIDDITAMSETPVTTMKARDIVYSLFENKNLEAEKQPYTVFQTVDDIMYRFKDGMGNKGETLWDLLNGITENQDWATGKSRVKDRVLWDSFYGKRANKKDEAFATIAALV